jgi:hypothetical protein
MSIAQQASVTCRVETELYATLDRLATHDAVTFDELARQAIKFHQDLIATHEAGFVTYLQRGNRLAPVIFSREPNLPAVLRRLSSGIPLDVTLPDDGCAYVDQLADQMYVTKAEALYHVLAVYSFVQIRINAGQELVRNPGRI